MHVDKVMCLMAEAHLNPVRLLHKGPSLSRGAGLVPAVTVSRGVLAWAPAVTVIMCPETEDIFVFFSLLTFIYFMYMSICPACMCTCVPCVCRRLLRPVEGIKYPGTGIDSC